MKKIVFFLAMYLCTAIIAFCQNKTITEYYDKDWIIVSSKENAAYYEVIESNSGQERTHGVIYYISGAKHSEGDYQSAEIRLKEGLWKEWYESGTQSSESFYKNGHHEGLQKDWYESGKKSGEIFYEEGGYQTIETRWYENGQIFYQQEFPDGNLKVYFENGKIMREARYIQRREVESKCFTETGQVIECELPFFRIPEPVGGMKELSKFVSKNMKYPKEALKKNLQGKVYVKFLINEDGSISDVKVVKSLHPLLDNEAIRVVSLMLNWIPGVQNGKIVKVKYTLPLSFYF